MCVLACRLELKWSHDNPYVKFLLDLCVCVDDVVRLGGGGVLEWVQIFILAEGLKIEFLGIIR